MIHQRRGVQGIGMTSKRTRDRLVARLRDSRRTEGFDYVREADVTLEPRQHLIVDFHSKAGGFIIK